MAHRRHVSTRQRWPLRRAPRFRAGIPVTIAQLTPPPCPAPVGTGNAPSSSPRQPQRPRQLSVRCDARVSTWVLKEMSTSSCCSCPASCTTSGSPTRATETSDLRWTGVRRRSSLPYKGFPGPTRSTWVWEAMHLAHLTRHRRARGALAHLTRAGVGAEEREFPSALPRRRPCTEPIRHCDGAVPCAEEIVRQAQGQPEKAPIARELVRERAERGSTGLEEAALLSQ